MDMCTGPEGLNDEFGPNLLFGPNSLGATAEGARFELAVRGYRTLVFKTSSIGRSDNLP